ncbi:hypothetical protein CCR94_23055 [Rhodoblastus sphagnicola]|uniref:DUF2946 domain-containing protein n=1 Tax=Rhodoblastus sphagnicola TaxID=333368 RepID=A0A2S6MUV8_9HYPH|nr:DUF2946 family protein [Rhodoblastus sphagnicola]MBB4199824.1 hypothetical protein [Rhodoblastus sphagnicola]PPQ26144.1 hypothetical protein CCR94_23055 [Rhodoblastus sphagnicola]
MSDLRKLKWKAVIAALYAVTALLLGFAHVRVVAPFPSSQTAAARALPDGTAIPICGGAPSDGNGPGAPAHAGSGVCDACLLTAAPGWVAAPPRLFAPVSHAIRMTIARNLTSAAKTFALAPQSRGPPKV